MADLMQQAREIAADVWGDIAPWSRKWILSGGCDAETWMKAVLAALRTAPAVETLSESDKEVALAQAVELAQYVEKNAKGGMREAAARFLSLSYAQDVAQRLRGAPTGTDEYLAYLEAAVDEAGFVIKHDGGSLGNSNFRIEPKVPASPSIPLKVFSEGPWVFGETGQQFSGADLDGAAFAAYQQCNAPCAAPEGFVLVPIAEVASALDVVRDAMECAYHNRFPECCGQYSPSGCCGNPREAWSKEDQSIMDALHPAEQALAAMLAARPQEPRND